MRREGIFVSVLALTLMSLGVLAPWPVLAQVATPTAMSGHPLVGVWVLDPEPDDSANPPELYAFTADGLVIGAEFAGGDIAGLWEATGPQTAHLTLLFHTLDDTEEGFAGWVRVRSTIEVAVDGQSFTAPYTLEFETPDGTRSGEFGPATATATRVMVEPMGVPIGSLADLFGDAAATPVP